MPSSPVPGLRLTPTSYIILGLLARVGQATPYELKQAVAQTVGNIWSVPHSQVYREPERLTAAGYVSEQREEGGRRRRHYALTEAGRAALEDWIRAPTSELPEIRDLALLKVFCGARPADLAAAQVEAHRGRLVLYETVLGVHRDAVPDDLRFIVETGIEYERNSIAFWSRHLPG